MSQLQFKVTRVNLAMKACIYVKKSQNMLVLTKEITQYMILIHTNQNSIATF